MARLAPGYVCVLPPRHAGGRLRLTWKALGLGFLRPSAENTLRSFVISVPSSVLLLPFILFSLTFSSFSSSFSQADLMHPHQVLVLNDDNRALLPKKPTCVLGVKREHSPGAWRFSVTTRPGSGDFPHSRVPGRYLCGSCEVQVNGQLGLHVASLWKCLSSTREHLASAQREAGRSVFAKGHLLDSSERASVSMQMVLLPAWAQTLLVESLEGLLQFISTGT